MKKQVSLLLWILSIVLFSTLSNAQSVDLESVEIFKDFPIKISRAIINIEEGKKIGYMGAQRLGDPFPYKSMALDVYNINFRRKYSFYEYDYSLENGIRSDIIDLFIEEGFKLNINDFEFAELADYTKPKLAISLFINDFVYNMQGSFDGSVNVFRSFLDMQIKVLSLVDNTVVYDYSNINEFYFKKEDRTYAYNFRYIFREALRQSLKELIYREEFFDVILNAKKQRNYDTFEDTINIAKVPLNKDNNSIAKRSIESTVTLTLGNKIGSGAFITKDGLILTCSHVVEGATEYDVILSNNVKVKGKVIRVSPEFDVALVQVEGIEVKPLPLGKSLNIEEGEEVYTIGTPNYTNLGQSISKGIVSGIRVIDEYSFLQTDASVNPGNSGGPLINAKGEIIGVVNMKVIKQGTERIGFAVPIDVAVEKLNLKVLDK